MPNIDRGLCAITSWSYHKRKQHWRQHIRNVRYIRAYIYCIRLFRFVCLTLPNIIIITHLGGISVICALEESNGMSFFLPLVFRYWLMVMRSWCKVIENAIDKYKQNILSFNFLFEREEEEEVTEIYWAVRL